MKLLVFLALLAVGGSMAQAINQCSQGLTEEHANQAAAYFAEAQKNIKDMTEANIDNDVNDYMNNMQTIARGCGCDAKSWVNNNDAYKAYNNLQNPGLAYGAKKQAFLTVHLAFLKETIAIIVGRTDLLDSLRSSLNLLLGCLTGALKDLNIQGLLSKVNLDELLDGVKILLDVVNLAGPLDFLRCQSLLNQLVGKLGGVLGGVLGTVLGLLAPILGGLLGGLGLGGR